MLNVENVFEDNGIIVELTISGEDFWEDLAWLKEVIDYRDREYCEVSHIWQVRNPERYYQIPAIKRAVESWKRQLRFL